MNSGVQISINGKNCRLGFGMEVFIILGNLWGVDTLEEVNERFQVLSSISEGGKTSLKNMITISEIIEAMVKAEPSNTETITALEVRTLPVADFQNVVINLIKGFSKNMPQAEIVDDEKKLNPKRRKA